MGSYAGPGADTWQDQVHYGCCIENRLKRNVCNLNLNVQHGYCDTKLLFSWVSATLGWRSVALFRNPHTSHQLLTTPENMLIHTVNVCVWHHQPPCPNNVLGGGVHPGSSGGSQQVPRLKSLLGGRPSGQHIGVAFIQQVYKVSRANSTSRLYHHLLPADSQMITSYFINKLDAIRKEFSFQCQLSQPSIYIHKLCLPSTALGKLSQLLWFHPLFLLKDFDLATIHSLSWIPGNKELSLAVFLEDLPCMFKAAPPRRKQSPTHTGSKWDRFYFSKKLKPQTFFSSFPQSRENSNYHREHLSNPFLTPSSHQVPCDFSAAIRTNCWKRQAHVLSSFSSYRCS